MSAKKRRTRSAADIEVDVNFEVPVVDNSQQRNRRRSNARQARLVGIPIMNPSQTQTNFFHYPPSATTYNPSIQTIGMVPYPQMPFQQDPPPIVNNQTISFTLLPGRHQILHNFAYEEKFNQKVQLFSSNQVMALTFNINGVFFNSKRLPFEVTSYLNSGQNTIMFSTVVFFAPIYVELRISEARSINDLVQSVVSNNQIPMHLPPSPGMSKICPISNNTIVYPGRGCKCKHSNCFDIRSFIERGIKNGIWECPFCHEHISYHDLLHDKDYFQTIISIDELTNNDFVFGYPDYYD